MNIKIFKVCTFITVSFFINNAAADLCASDKYVSTIEAGDISGLQHGHDGGNAVNVRFVHEDGRHYRTLPLNRNRNANDDNGKAMLSLLKTAMVMRLKVSVWDHYGTRCDDFDQVRINRD